MKRLLTLVLSAALGALALGCAVESGEPTDEQAGEQAEGLLEGEEDPTTTGRGVTGGSGLTKTADPNGPSPYPWQPKVYDEDPNGPSPYPWDTSGSGSGSTGAGSGDDTGDDESSSGQQGTGTSGH